MTFTKKVNLNLYNKLIYKYIVLSPSYRNYSRPYQSCRLAAIVTGKRCLRQYIYPPPVPLRGSRFLALQRVQAEGWGCYVYGDAEGVSHRSGTTAFVICVFGV